MCFKEGPFSNTFSSQFRSTILPPTIGDKLLLIELPFILFSRWFQKILDFWILDLLLVNCVPLDKDILYFISSFWKWGHHTRWSQRSLWGSLTQLSISSEVCVQCRNGHKQGRQMMCICKYKLPYFSNYKMHFPAPKFGRKRGCIL